MKESSSEIMRVLALFKEAGFSGFATTDPEKARAKLKEWEQPGIVCNYRGQARKVHPEVCKWHQEMSDPDCLHCKVKRAQLRFNKPENLTECHQKTGYTN